MVIWSGKSPVLTFLFVRVYARARFLSFLFLLWPIHLFQFLFWYPLSACYDVFITFYRNLLFFFPPFPLSPPRRLVYFRRDQSGAYTSANRKVVANFGKALASNIDLSTPSASTPRHLNDPLSSHLLRIDMRHNRRWFVSFIFSFGDRLQLESIA